MDYCVLNYWHTIWKQFKILLSIATYFNPLVYLLVYKRVSLCLKKIK
jgi:hypothetical protein